MHKRASVLAVSSGKGGVGKTNISTNLAIALARCGHRVCVFDADTSLANVNVLLDLRPRTTLEHLLRGEAEIGDILLETEGGISIVPAASGIAEFARLSPEQQERLLTALTELESRFDYLLIDTAAGISDNVTAFLRSVRHCLLVVTPEPTSLTDAFALVKVMGREQVPTMHVLVNMAGHYAESVDVYKRLAGACTRYLSLEPRYFGYIPRDDYLCMAVQQQKPVLLAYPRSGISSRFLSLARNTDRLLRAGPPPRPFSLFWSKLLRGGRKTAARPTPATAEAAKPATAPGRSPNYSKARVLKLHGSLAGLIKSRRMPARALGQLLVSVLRLAHRHYPELDIEELQRRARQER